MKKNMVFYILWIILLISSCNVPSNINVSTLISYTQDFSGHSVIYKIFPAKNEYHKIEIPHIINGLAYLPSNSYWVYSSSSIFLLNSSNGEEKEIISSDIYLGNLVLSPNEKYLAFSEIFPENEVATSIYKFQDKSIMKVSQSIRSTIFPQDWSSDSSNLLIIEENQDQSYSLSFFDMENLGFKEIIHFNKKFIEVGSAKLSPDGKYIVFEATISEDGKNSRICLLEVNKPNEIVFLNIPTSSKSPVWSPDGKKIAYIYKQEIDIFNLSDSSITQLPVPKMDFQSLVW